MANRTNQRGLPLEAPRAPSRAAHAPFSDWTPLGPPLPFETIPEWLRLPGEPGWIELDQFMRRVGVKRGAG